MTLHCGSWSGPACSRIAKDGGMCSSRLSGSQEVLDCPVVVVLAQMLERRSVELH